MKNVIKYYYDFDIDGIIYKNNYYEFVYEDKLYHLIMIEENNEKIMENINNYSKNNYLINEIIMNRFNKLISLYNNISLILIEINININKKITLSEISYIAKTFIENKPKEYTNWGELWSKRIDYLETQISENGKKHPLLVDSFNFFVGMSENAISYYNSISLDNNSNSIVLSHRKIKINDTIYVLYNPLNIIIDHKSRDIAEYIKIAFFENNTNIFNELELYFKYNFYTITDIKILFSRVLYPTFYFDLYDDIILDIKKERDIINITDNIDKYINYLYQIFLFLNKYYQLDEVLWLKKRINFH